MEGKSGVLTRRQDARPWVDRLLIRLNSRAQLHFADDAQEPAFELKHKLKLYSGEDPQANQNPKKPVRALTGLSAEAECYATVHGSDILAVSAFVHTKVPAGSRARANATLLPLVRR